MMSLVEAMERLRQNMPKCGVATALTVEVVKQLFGIPENIILDMHYDFSREIIVLRFRSPEPASFIFLGQRINVSSIVEGQEYPYFRLSKNGSIHMMGFYSQMEVAKEVNSINE